MFDLWVHRRRATGEIRYRHGGYTLVFGMPFGRLRDLLAVADPARDNTPRKPDASADENSVESTGSRGRPRRPHSATATGATVISLQQFRDRRRPGGKATSKGSAKGNIGKPAPKQAKSGGGKDGRGLPGRNKSETAARPVDR